MAVHMQAVQPVLPPWLFKLLSTAIRLLNNVVGGMSFVRIGPVNPTPPELLVISRYQAETVWAAGNSGKDAQGAGVVSRHDVAQ